MHIKFNDLFLKMQEQLEISTTVPDEKILIALVQRIRPADSNDSIEIQQRLNALFQALLLTPTAATCFQAYLVRLLNRYKQTNLYADSGILSLDGFWNQLSQRIGAHFLPLLPNESQLQYLVGQVFNERNDQYWLENIPDQLWIQLFGLLNKNLHDTTAILNIEQELIKAITVLSYRISGIGLYPEFINAQPELGEYESPFLVQNREIVEFIELYKKQHRDTAATAINIPPDASQALVMFEQCRDVVYKIRRATKRIGVSISLTYLLSLLEQCLDRIEILLTILVE